MLSWNVTAVSSKLGFEPRSFCRMVERSVGCPAKAWLRHHRISTACHLLREGWKIEALSADFGFSHASAFTREFKAMVGVTPSYYVQKERSRFFLPPPPDEDE
jgi:AraC-like DNA-binding protein